MLRDQLPAAFSPCLPSKFRGEQAADTEMVACPLSDDKRVIIQTERGRK